jgi:hypothetical protein
MRYPTTPDGRYFLVAGRLWRCSDPSLDPAHRDRLVHDLMTARSAVGRALKAQDEDSENNARAAVHRAKVALGERGEPWWDDGAPDFNRHLAKNTPYAEWAGTVAGPARSASKGD